MAAKRLFPALITALCVAPLSAWGGLIGTSVTLRYDFTPSNFSTVDVVTVGNGVEISCTGSGSGNANVCSLLTAPIQTVDIGDLSITYSYSGNGAAFVDVTPKPAKPEPNRSRFWS